MDTNTTEERIYFKPTRRTRNFLEAVSNWETGPGAVSDFHLAADVLRLDAGSVKFEYQPGDGTRYIVVAVRIGNFLGLAATPGGDLITHMVDFGKLIDADVDYIAGKLNCLNHTARVYCELAMHLFGKQFRILSRYDIE